MTQEQDPQQQGEGELPELELPEIDPTQLDTYVDQPGGAPEPAPGEQPAGEGQSISLVEGQTAAASQSKIHRSAQGLTVQQKSDFRRALNITGTGATRCKIFYSKIASGPIDYLQKAINDWLDQEDVEVKFVTQVVGVMEGKRAEPNLVITLWY